MVGGNCPKIPSGCASSLLLKWPGIFGSFFFSATWWRQTASKLLRCFFFGLVDQSWAEFSTKNHTPQKIISKYYDYLPLFCLYKALSHIAKPFPTLLNLKNKLCLIFCDSWALPRSSFFVVLKKIWIVTSKQPKLNIEKSLRNKLSTLLSWKPTYHITSRH